MKFQTVDLTPTPRKQPSHIFNGTNRAYLIISTLITVILMTIVVVVGPQHFSIPKIKFYMCDDSNIQECSLNRTPYIFAFGLMLTWFISGFVYLLFSPCRFTISKYIIPFQIVIQIISTIGATYIRDVVFKIGYWMFFSSLKYYFFQSILLIQTIQYVYHSYLVHGDRHKTTLLASLLSLALYFVFAIANGLWFFGPQCDNHYDILFICIVTTNILTTLGSIFDHTYGVFLPLQLATISQIYLFLTLNATPDALQCGSSRINYPATQWVILAIILIAIVILPSIKIIFYYTSQISINDLFINQLVRSQGSSNNDQFRNHNGHVSLTVERGQSLLFNSDIQNNNRNMHNKNDNLSFSSFSSQNSTSHSNTLEDIHINNIINSPSAPRHYLPNSLAIIDEVDHDVFVEHYFFTSEKRCAPVVKTFFLGTYIFALFTFSLTHSLEHRKYTSLGINSNHLQYFYAMNIAWVYLIYIWSLISRNYCPKKNCV
jgi:hypothetical protein